VDDEAGAEVEADVAGQEDQVTGLQVCRVRDGDAFVDLGVGGAGQGDPGGPVGLLDQAYLESDGWCPSRR
jgi:hypothetical protein